MIGPFLMEVGARMREGRQRAAMERLGMVRGRLLLRVAIGLVVRGNTRKLSL